MNKSHKSMHGGEIFLLFIFPEILYEGEKKQWNILEQRIPRKSEERKVPNCTWKFNYKRIFYNHTTLHICDFIPVVNT